MVKFVCKINNLLKKKKLILCIWDPILQIDSCKNICIFVCFEDVENGLEK